MGRRRGRRRTNGKKVVLELEAAHELVDLVEDEPGDANEDLLDEAYLAIDRRSNRLEADAQRMVAEGAAVAVEVDDEAAGRVKALIAREPVPLEDEPVRTFGRRLSSKLRTASKKRESA
ncbi:MAG: hypothetical protein S0880_24200 [Actinomycetota bacterium]|nr:hypothetical protein [Actinomycetota bacterium]